MIWILIRHAHRDTSDRELDNGLSKKGQEQAQKLKRYFEKRFEGERIKISIFSSPKKRCMETLQPIAESLNQKIARSDELLEQTGNESPTHLKRRVERFVKEHEKRGGVLVLCSHGDWIPLAVAHACGAQVDSKKGSWIEIEDGHLNRILTPQDL